MYAEPVTAVMFAALFLAEPLTWATVIGGAGVVAAGVLVARMKPAARSPTAGMEASIIAEALESSGTNDGVEKRLDPDRSEA